MGPVFYFALDDVFRNEEEAKTYLESHGVDGPLEEICPLNEWDVFRARFSQAKEEGKDHTQALAFACEKAPD